MKAISPLAHIHSLLFYLIISEEDEDKATHRTCVLVSSIFIEYFAYVDFISASSFTTSSGGPYSPLQGLLTLRSGF